ncbi:helix-turn-helix domain-containing protein [Streptomyces sp. MP131-18]|uniref:winged helix-turn-helix domain-containing protein n=1 Tax=Streptomyces sp. MP131-18 TaxID=1857892 RepID=UPI0009A1CEED|nr:helix-turn-helix domain-containing protein [Streptomyces sp. MP131-18]ONK14417.1 putative transcriptional regulator [Streptomyces sp. MP131-18]
MENDNEPAAPEPSAGPFAQSHVRLTDPKALRAYSHPTRMQLVGLLRLRGPLTATEAAQLTGQSVASCSYHLRMLAKHGLVEEDESGTGRQKPWRATARYTSWPDHSDDPAVAEASTALSTMVAETWFERVLRAIETRGTLPREWQEAEEFSDEVLFLLPAELKELRTDITALLDKYADRADPARRPEGALPVEFLRIAYARQEGDYGGDPR